MSAVRLVPRLCLPLLLLSGCGVGPASPADSPPVDPTHHAVVRGRVLGASEQPLAGVGVGARFSPSSPPDRRVSATGGANTDAGGAYVFELRTSAPANRDGTADVYIHAAQYAPAGGQVLQDSVLVTLRLSPLGEPAPTTTIQPIRLPVRPHT